MVMLYAICKCSYIIWNRTRKEIKESLADSGPMGIHKIDDPQYQYERNDVCRNCDTPLLITERFTKKSVHTWAEIHVGKILKESYPNTPPDHITYYRFG